MEYTIKVTTSEDCCSTQDMNCDCNDIVEKVRSSFASSGKAEIRLEGCSVNLESCCGPSKSASR